MEKLFNDRARLIALLELLPEQFIDDLVNDYCGMLIIHNILI
jgi:hypothetical protein